ncbi:MAG: Gfo/Idh/MocA family oxidoreductase [Deltaproteobacteria bacterium]|nr:Gfo/Idh/MocA family oxidoreductase [Deltaproteobacteria bacterium]
MGNLRVAVIGTGYLGRFHAQKYAALEGVDLVGVADVDPAAAGAAAKEARTRAFSSHKELLGRVDAVSVVVPTLMHYPVARDFLEAGCDVLLEKPMTTTLEEADALVELAESRGLIMQVGHLERFNPAVRALRQAGVKPRFIEARRLSTFKPRAVGVSVVLDLMIHDLDICCALAGCGVKRVKAGGSAVLTDSVDVANAFLEMENGCVASLTASRLAPEDRREIRVFGKEAYLEVDFISRRFRCSRKSGAAAGNGLPALDVEERTFGQADALADEIAAFVHSVKKREAPEVNGPVGRQALACALEVLKKIGKGAPR